ncbi:MAG: tetraacyldisaccharide 4'-kinase, partial [Planctomycetia bacterium]|nr:tetraacyldisaccharide 4'-kinase [Planctomycetia bacterium]
MEHSQEFLKDSPGMEERYLQLVSGRRRGLLASMARGALTAGAQLYRAGLFFNRLYYRLPWTTYRMSVPIVSIGNLTVGGTGKTPMTALVARKLLASGRRPGIASRGYMAAEDGTNEELALLA